MAGARDRAGAGVSDTAHEVPNDRLGAKWSRLARWLLVLLVVVCAPATWLVARDMLPLAIASTEFEREQIHAAIYTDLSNEMYRAEAFAESDRLTLPARAHAPPCYSVPFSAFRQEEPVVLSEHGAASDLNYGLIRINLAAESLAQRVDQIDRLESALSPLEASLLRACITASPFASQCFRTVSKINRDTMGSVNRSRKQDKDLEIPVLTPVESPPGTQLYCATMPLLIP